MKFGIAFANIVTFTQHEGLVTLAQGAEAAGFESLWTVEHVVVPEGYESTYPYDPSGKMPGGERSPIPDPLIWLAYLAAATETINLATGILILPQRNPVVLAKELATLDRMSKGRMIAGIGVGWLEEEFDAIGVPFADRGRRTDAYVEAMRALWSGEPASHDSGFASFSNAILQPTPVRGSVPIHVGGHTEAAARRAGRLGDGWIPSFIAPEQLASGIPVALEAAAKASLHLAGEDYRTVEVWTARKRAVALMNPGIPKSHYLS